MNIFYASTGGCVVVGVDHHPQSIDSSSGDASEKKLEESEEDAHFGASIVIGALLVVPVVVIFVTVTVMRLRKKSSFLPLPHFLSSFHDSIFHVCLRVKCCQCDELTKE